MEEIAYCVIILNKSCNNCCSCITYTVIYFAKPNLYLTGCHEDLLSFCSLCIYDMTIVYSNETVNAHEVTI